MWITLVLLFPFRVKCCVSSTSKEESTLHTYISVSVFIFSKEKERGAADIKRKDDWGIKKATHRQFCGLSGMLIVLLQNTEMQPRSQKVLSSVPAKAFAALHTCLFFSAIFADTFVNASNMSDIVVLAHMNEFRVEAWQKSPLILHAALFDQPLAGSLTWPSRSVRLSLEPRQDLLSSLLLWFKKECSFFQFYLLYSWSVCFHNLW